MFAGGRPDGVTPSAGLGVFGFAFAGVGLL